MRPKHVIFALVLAAAAALLLSDPASAQCAMCRKALEQNGGTMASSFNNGILFLLATPYLVFAIVGGTWYWKRHQAARRRTPLRESPWRTSLTPSPR